MLLGPIIGTSACSRCFDQLSRLTWRPTAQCPHRPTSSATAAASRAPPRAARARSLRRRRSPRSPRASPRARASIGRSHSSRATLPFTLLLTRHPLSISAATRCPLRHFSHLCAQLRTRPAARYVCSRHSPLSAPLRSSSCSHSSASSCAQTSASRCPASRTTLTSHTCMHGGEHCATCFHLQFTHVLCFSLFACRQSPMHIDIVQVTSNK